MGLFSDGPRGISPQLAEAIETMGQRLKANPADTGAALRLADALTSSGRRSEAVRLLNRIGPIVQKRGKVEEAIAIFKKAAQLDPNFELTSTTFLSYVQLQRLIEAEKEVLAAAAPVAAPPMTGSFRIPDVAAVPPPSGTFTAPDAAAVPAAPSAWSQKKETVHGYRAGIPLLRDIPPLLIDLVLERINLITLGPGDVLFREGSEGNSVFFVLEGTLDVTGRNDLGVEVLLRRAKPGESIGETSFLTSLPRGATVTARERADLLELDRNALTPIARKHRPLADALNRLYEERVLLGALARSRLFGVLSEAERRELAGRLGLVSVKAGTPLVRQGEMDKVVYIVKRGALRVTIRSGDRDVAIALLRPHEVFGELAHVRTQARTATVTAVTESELLWLPSNDLVALCARYPQLSAALDEIQLERFMKKAEALSKPG
jgi:CRP-like cAMP-binding protein